LDAQVAAGLTADAEVILVQKLETARSIAVNVCERGGRLYETNRTEIIWTAEHISKFCGVASEPLQFALLLALWTGQRQGDLVRLTWMQYDGSKIRLRQGKSRGKRRVVIPVGPPLKTALDGRRPAKAEGAILRNTLGEPWTTDGFKTSWGKAFDRAGLGDEDLHFHDLRGTAVTRLALSGCTVPEIAAITGHSPRDVEAILEAHYLGGRVELAEQAIAKLVAKYGSGT
jgi:integrase